MKDINYIDWGLIDYKEAWDRQEGIFNGKIDEKLSSPKTSSIQQDFILCEHPHVYTLGMHGEVNISRAGFVLPHDITIRIF